MSQQAADFIACKARGERFCAALSASDFLSASLIAPLAVLAAIAILPVLARRFMMRRV